MKAAMLGAATPAPAPAPPVTQITAATPATAPTVATASTLATATAQTDAHKKALREAALSNVSHAINVQFQNLLDAFQSE